MTSSPRSLAVVTGASSGIGLELGKQCARHRMDILVAADEAAIHPAAAELRRGGVDVEAVQADLGTTEGVDRLLAALGDRQPDCLIANAGRGLGRGFLDQEWGEVRHVVDTNVTGTIYLIHQIGRRMRARGRGRILIVGSIAGLMPGTYQAVYNGTKAFLDSFSFALRAELAGSGVTVTCLMPGATDTRFFERARLMDTKVGVSRKQAPEEVARLGFEAMLRGDGEVITGFTNKLRAAASHLLPNGLLAGIHAKQAAPGSASAG